MTKKEIEKKIAKLDKWILQIEKYQKNAPAGSLHFQKKRGRLYYTQRIFDNDTNRWKDVYIRKKDIERAAELAQKGYYEDALPIFRQNVFALKKIEKYCSEDDLADVYDHIPAEKRSLITPIVRSPKTILAEWNSEQYEPNKAHEENLQYETDQGEVVRSKSERHIANRLFQNKMKLLYKYERPLELNHNGEKIVIHPDFTVLNIATGKIVYWEHVGRIGEMKYASDFVHKHNLYIENGIIPGRDVYFTFETNQSPLGTATVRRVINLIISDD